MFSVYCLPYWQHKNDDGDDYYNKVSTFHNKKEVILQFSSTHSPAHQLLCHTVAHAGLAVLIWKAAAKLLLLTDLPLLLSLHALPAFLSHKTMSRLCSTDSQLNVRQQIRVSFTAWITSDHQAKTTG